eukprot:5742855-Prymnesium_polylepis.1
MRRRAPCRAALHPIHHNIGTIRQRQPRQRAQPLRSPGQGAAPTCKPLGCETTELLTSLG